MVSPLEEQKKSFSLKKESLQIQKKDREGKHPDFPDLITSDKGMLDTLSTVFKISKSTSPVLILGESGTGKELIAKAIHKLSRRKDKTLVTINCSAIPEQLLESELFGYEKGAFTGADKKRIGHFGIANGGSIFLDEIGEMPLKLQAKLLRVLQESKYTPLGSNEPKEIDIRIIAATNKDLHKDVQKNLFRLDLYYRLNVLTVNLPPLRERKGDITLLVHYFLKKFMKKNLITENIIVNAETLKLLNNYSWPGNVRELENIIERLFILRDKNMINKNDLPSELLQVSPKKDLAPNVAQSFVLDKTGIDLNDHIDKIEKTIIIAALKATKNNKQKAAELLRLKRTTLVEKIKKKKIILTY